MKIRCEVNNVLKDRDFTTKVYLYFSSAAAGDDYDPYENRKVETLLNPKVIKARVQQISAEALVYRQYGLSNMGAIEIICLDKYYDLFKNCSKIIVDSVEYQVFKTPGGNKAVIQKRAGNLLRVVLSRNG